MSAVSGLEIQEPSIFQRGAPGRKGTDVPDPGDATPSIPAGLLRKSAPGLPSVSEQEVVRHFTRLSRRNYGIDVGFYPLGSCTMKHNPRINEDVAGLKGFKAIHPYSPPARTQGALAVMWELAEALAEISGMTGVSLAPAAGAHGELTGMLVIRKALEARGDPRKKVLIPDTAHGTNPASCVLCNYKAVEVKSSQEGILDPASVAQAMDEDVAAIMITNPNTLGLFEVDLPKVADIVHDKGGLVYGDGANLNAIMGRVRPACLGLDVIQFNLHKTFSTPHGGGGPGAGPVGVVKDLDPFLPVPRVVRGPDGSYALSEDFPSSIGRMRTFAGQFGVMVRALTYIRALGAAGLKDVSDMAVLNANYLRARLCDHFHLPFSQPCMHEVVFSDQKQAGNDVHTMDMAKALMDRGFHPPTVYFPLIVSGAIMIEPTETEDRATLDEFVEAMVAIASQAESDPESLHETPTLTSVSRPDEVLAARKPVLTWPGT
ncbi:MAG: aminomethyl-transferring glycine dehydrogenase subunit GcvPB [Deltaproteobacteria bacterium]|nr:aminomethyl-transferring glycine dehydrogenase subunit GcvPB [Deltaproteobacteria bacterium]